MCGDDDGNKDLVGAGVEISAREKSNEERVLFPRKAASNAAINKSKMHIT